jgi:hypothetical protein
MARHVCQFLHGGRMVEVVSRIGRLAPGEYWVEDVICGVQVGWVNRDPSDRQWYILDDGFERRAGPFRTLKDAATCVEDVLRSEFGVGSPAN